MTYSVTFTQQITMKVFVATPSVSAEVNNPLSTVIDLMDSLTAKITAEGEAEAKAYKEYVEWCDNAAANVKNEIKTATSKKEQLEASIGKSTNDASSSASKIEDLAASISSDESELKEATTVREKEATDFAASEAELVDAIVDAMVSTGSYLTHRP